MQCPNRVRARVQKTDLYTPPTVAYGEAYSIRPYDWVRAILRNTDAIPQLDTYGPSKNRPVSVPFGAVEWAYSIRLYNRVRARVQKNGSVYATVGGVWWGVCDTPLQPGTCEGLKNGSVYATDGGVWWGVFDTPLRPGMCDPSKYRCNSPTGYVRSFEIPMQFPDWVRAALQKTIPFSSPSGSLGGAYAIRPYGWVHAIFRNTDAILQLGTYNPSKYRCDHPTGYVCPFEISVQHPNRLRAILRNTDTIS